MTHSYKILLIDDDPSFRAVVAKFLGVTHAVESAENLQAATQALKSRSFDLVLLDRGLPDGDGISLIPTIKKSSPTTAIIVITGNVDFNSLTKCIFAGADDYVIKSENTVPELFVRIPVVVNNVSLRLKTESSQNSYELQIPQSTSEFTPENYKSFMQEAEKAYLSAALHSCNGDASHVARSVGLGKSTIFKKISELGLGRKSRPRPSPEFNCNQVEVPHEKT